MKTILIVEDDELVRESLYEILKHQKYSVVPACDAEEGLQKVSQRSFDMALIDLRLPRMTGLDFLRKVRKDYPDMSCVMMTSFATVETAVEAMKLGAFDYITKPINDDELKILLARIEETQALRIENTSLKKEIAGERDHFGEIIGADPKMQKIYSIIQAIRNTETTVLIKGDSGTGKGMVAQAIHAHDPARKDKAYVEVSCGAIPRELLESELFGHVKGAFTSAHRDRIGRFELADGGTILLDEIDALPSYLQVKLLRVLQQKEFEMVGDTKTKKVNVRIIVATNRDLEEEIKKGSFREDLYYRLNVITIEMPHLRDRKEDIPALIKHFLAYFKEKTGRHDLKGITKEAMKALVNYSWPGNVRELENTLERVVVLCQNEYVTPQDLPESIARDDQVQGNDYSQSGSLKSVLKGPEKQIILQALEQAGWNRKKAANILNINRTTLYNKMKEHELL